MGGKLAEGLRKFVVKTEREEFEEKLRELVVCNIIERCKNK